ncbi:hypothetical protein FRC12_001791 [Ceratobasidium sp. 428]|nr:hypothetical protein FRC12_001791 [Ceratobasidium sp. 428]
MERRTLRNGRTYVTQPENLPSRRGRTRRNAISSSHPPALDFDLGTNKNDDDAVQSDDRTAPSIKNDARTVQSDAIPAQPSDDDASTVRPSTALVLAPRNAAAKKTAKPKRKTRRSKGKRRLTNEDLDQDNTRGGTEGPKRGRPSKSKVTRPGIHPATEGIDELEEADVSGLIMADRTRMTEEYDNASEIEAQLLQELSPRAPQYIVQDDVQSIDSNKVRYRTPKVFDIPISPGSERERMARRRSPSAPPHPNEGSRVEQEGKPRRIRRHTVTAEALKSYEILSVVSDKTQDIISWDEEVTRAGSTDPPQYLYDEDIEGWKNPFWQKKCLPSGELETEPAPIELNAFICEVNDDYVNNDEQYEEVLYQLRRAHEQAAAALREHEAQAGPSKRQENPVYSVSVEEVEPSEAAYHSSTTEMSTAKGKGKPKPKNGKKVNDPKPKAKRPNLGLNINELQTTERKTPKKKKRESDAYQACRTGATPQGFRGGGYLEFAHGRAGNGPASLSAGSENRSRARTQPSSRSRTAESGAGGGGNLPPRPPTRRGSPSTDRSSDNASAAGGDPSSDPSSNDGSDGSSSDSDSSNDSLSTDNSSVVFDDAGVEEYVRRAIRQERERNRRREAREKEKRQEKRIKELEKKVLIQARSGFKAEKPESWDGNPDFDEFELLAFNYDNWCADTKQTDEEAVRHFGSVLTPSKKASKWYLTNVATNWHNYTMTRVYQDIFEYCFPADFKETLRKEYDDLEQKDMSVQDHFARLNLLRRRLKGISSRQHVLKAHDCANAEIQCEWALKGIDPEVATFDELKESAIDIKRALKIRQRYKKKEAKERRNRSSSPLRNKDNKYKTTNDRYKDNGHKRHKRDNDKDNRKDNGQHKNRDRRTERSSNWKNRSKNDKDRKPGLTDKQKDEYRAANKCFSCSEVGHMAKDCPKKNRARPSHVRSSAASVKPEQKVRASTALLQELDRLTKTQESIEVSATRVEAPATKTKTKATKRKQIEQKHVERNAVRVKDVTRKVPNTIVIQAELQGESV